MIIIGVSDEGDLVGLDEARTADGRDLLLRRVEGICRGTVKPSITPAARFAVEKDQVVLVLIVPKGSQPIYYSNNVPYVRHITESRPAEPHEVIERVRSRIPVTEVSGEREDPYSAFLSCVAAIVVDVIIYGEEADQREVNPWVDMWRAQFASAAGELRELAAQDIAETRGMAGELTKLATALDRVASFKLYMGCGPEFSGRVNEVLELARRFKHERIDPLPVSQASLDVARKTVVSASRRLADVKSRMHEMVDQGRVQDLQAEASAIGYEILRISHYQIDDLLEGLSERLRAIGRRLHLIETMQLFLDGGRSVRAVCDAVQQGADELAQVATELQERM